MATTFLSPMSWSFADRLRAAGIHFLLSCLIAAAVAALVFLVWYPYPYRELVGGRSLFILVVSVDVVMGPLLTFAVFDRKKGWPHLRRDLAVIGLLQLAALAYGVYVVALARPVHLVYEIDRFRAVTAADIDPSTLREARPEFRELPLAGPTLIAAPKPTDNQAYLRSVDLGMQGFDLGQQPGTWVAYDQKQRQLATEKAVTVRNVMNKLVAAKRAPEAALLEQAALEAKLKNPVAPHDLLVLPLVTRQLYWAVILDREGTPVAYAPVDVFL